MFPRIVKSQMLAWLTDTIQSESALPTDHEIVERFDLSGVEIARSLLATLADEGAITIRGFGAERRIALGRPPRASMHEKPLRTIVKRVSGKREVDLDEGLARIRSILDRGKSATAPGDAADDPIDEAPEAIALPEPKPRSVSPTIVPACDGESEGAQESITPARVPAPHPIVEIDLKHRPLPSRMPDGSVQINIKLPPDLFPVLDARAASRDMRASAAARDILIDALTATDGAPDQVGKPMIRARVIVAHRVDGREFGAFVTHLIDLGLREHLRAASRA